MLKKPITNMEWKSLTNLMKKLREIERICNVLQCKMTVQTTQSKREVRFLSLTKYFVKVKSKHLLTLPQSAFYKNFVKWTNSNEKREIHPHISPFPHDNNLKSNEIDQNQNLGKLLLHLEVVGSNPAWGLKFFCAFFIILLPLKTSGRSKQAI